MHRAISPPSIIKEKKNGGLCSRRIEKSATNRLAKKGWSTKALRIFLQITIQLFIIEGEFSDDKRLLHLYVHKQTAKCLLESAIRFYYIQKIYVKENH
jgi:hypothetical protein